MSKISQTALEAYLKGVFRLLIIFFPATGALAAVTFTVLKALGSYPDVSWTLLIAFDAVSLSYILSAVFGFRGKDFLKNQPMAKVRRRAEILLAIILPLQFNFITYLFPSADFWAFSVFFVLLSAFLLSNRFVLVVTAEIIASLLLSWLLQPRLLPVQDADFITNMGLRFVLLCIALMSIWFLTYLVEKTLLAGVSAQTKEDEVNRVKNELTGIFKESFLGTYVSAYYVNLNDCSQYVFSRADYIEDKYGKIDNYLTSITSYILECVHPDDREKMMEAVQPSYIRERLLTEEGFSVYMRDISAGGQKWYHLIITRGADSDHAGLAFSDVTKKVEEDERRKSELQQALAVANHASKAKTDFLFNMSHDIRTPMNAIIGFTDMALGNLDNREKAQDYLNKVKLSSGMLLSLINDILDMSRIESGKVKLSEDKANIQMFIDCLESVIAGPARQKEIDIKFDTSGITDKYVYMDRPRLERILMNLLSNAVKYTSCGGKVNARLTQTDGGRKGFAMYRFEVEDNGIGMSEEFQKYMWDEFTREETSTVSGIQGTGLGLSLALKLTNLMGGEISCRSKQGEGSTFTVTVPLRLCDRQEIENEVEIQEIVQELDLSGKRALLVEDNELNREIATAILETYGLEIETAENGREAVDSVTGRDPLYYDFIFMDIQMPVMDGYEATREIRKQVPGLKAPIIALSANAFEEDKQKSRDAGMDDHVAKPVDTRELTATLVKFIG